MKKIVTIVMIGIAALGFTGCTEPKEEPKEVIDPTIDGQGVTVEQ